MESTRTKEVYQMTMEQSTLHHRQIVPLFHDDYSKTRDLITNIELTKGVTIVQGEKARAYEAPDEKRRRR